MVELVRLIVVEKGIQVTEEEIEQLKIELEKEEKIKQEKISFDAIAKEINKLPTRKQTTE